MTTIINTVTINHSTPDDFTVNKSDSWIVTDARNYAVSFLSFDCEKNANLYATTLANSDGSIEMIKAIKKSQFKIN